MKQFAKGQRIKLSEHGRESVHTGKHSGGRHGYIDWPNRRGTVTARNRGVFVCVQWDGNSTVGSYHTDCIDND